MRKLWNRILIKLGLRKPPRVGWKFYGGYGLYDMSAFKDIGWKYHHHTYGMNGEIVDE